jgi:hypothetical protein
MSTIKESVLSAQGHILDSLVACESQIAALYEAFAAAFPAAATFWQRMAREERQHSQALDQLHRMLARGHLFQNIGRFNEESLAGMRSTMTEAGQELAAKRMDLAASYAVAMKLECSLLECCFYATVTSDAPEFQAVSQILREETQQHVRRLKHEIEEHGKANMVFL